MSVRILAVHTGAIGDFVTALPALQRLAAAGELTVMGHAGRIALAPYAIDEVHTLDIESTDFHTAFSEPSETLRKAVAGFDAALVWFRDEDGALARGLRAAGVERVCAMPGVPLDGWTEHAMDYYHACVDRFFSDTGTDESATERTVCPKLRPPVEAKSGEVLIHPGSGSPKKNWPLENFWELAARLEGSGLPVRWLVGPAEEGWAFPAGAEVITETDLVRLATRMAAARLFIGNDSGMAHLAAACGCPTVAVFQASDPEVWMPRGERVEVVGKAGSPPTVNAVEGGARRMLWMGGRSD